MSAVEPGGQAGAAADPRFLISRAERYPPVIEQFLQLGLILIYPAWLVLLSRE